MDIASDTTRQVIDRRRLELLGRLREELGGVEHAADVPARALPLLRTAVHDLPWVDICLGVDASPEDGVVALEIPGAQGTLLVRLSDHLAPDDAYLGYLRLIAASLGQALTRIAAREAERDMSAVLQRSLLAGPPAQPGLDIAVRSAPPPSRLRSRRSTACRRIRASPRGTHRSSPSTTSQATTPRRCSSDDVGREILCAE